MTQTIVSLGVLKIVSSLPYSLVKMRLYYVRTIIINEISNWLTTLIAPCFIIMTWHF